MTENGFGNLNAFHCLLRVFTGRSYMYPEIPIHRDSRGHLFILSRNFFPIASVVVQMTYILWHLHLRKSVIEKVISSCGRGHYVMQKVVF